MEIAGEVSWLLASILLDVFITDAMLLASQIFTLEDYKLQEQNGRDKMCT